MNIEDPKTKRAKGSGDLQGCKGYTLIELCLVVAILGIVSSIALPAYSNYSLHAHQANAKAQVSKIAMALERYRHQHQSYEVELNELEIPDSDRWFDYSVHNENRLSYQIFAVPRSESTRLHRISLDQTGKRSHRSDSVGTTDWSIGWP